MRRTLGKRLNVDREDRPVLLTEQATTSGTEVDFLDLPRWVSQLKVMPDQVSLAGTADLLVQIGDSAGFATDGYTSGSGSASTNSAGFVIRLSNAGRAAVGVMTIEKVSGLTWTSSHSVHTDTNVDVAGAGRKVLTGQLDRVRVTITATATDSFDAGSINVSYR